MVKIVVPIVEDRGLDSKIAEHFGRAPYFAVFELNDKGEVIYFKTVSTVGEHFGGPGYTHDRILELKPDAIIVYGMGQRGLSTFQNHGIAVFKAEKDTVKDVIASYVKGEVRELTEGCARAHHH
ncbi:MAG: NifB/NifX family molybdenum-iron cluster-binding protein [Nitrososphaeria archaeon]|nr:NifB/NifX family molybdenum-iron cluster-binding protein [Nitrososphaeria archaeon]